MRNVLLIALLFSALNGLNAQNVNQAGSAAVETLQFKESGFDFGKIPQGRPVTHVFSIVNTGNEPIILEDVQASCGCTTPEWSRDPIPPGASSTIKVGYNSAAEGDFSKTVTVLYGDKKRKTIIISGNVYKAPATPAPLNSSISLFKQTNR